MTEWETEPTTWKQLTPSLIAILEDPYIPYKNKDPIRGIITAMGEMLDASEESTRRTLECLKKRHLR